MKNLLENLVVFVITQNATALTASFAVREYVKNNSADAVHYFENVTVEQLVAAEVDMDKLFAGLWIRMLSEGSKMNTHVNLNDLVLAKSAVDIAFSILPEGELVELGVTIRRLFTNIEVYATLVHQYATKAISLTVFAREFIKLLCATMAPLKDSGVDLTVVNNYLEHFGLQYLLLHVKYVVCQWDILELNALVTGAENPTAPVSDTEECDAVTEEDFEAELVREIQAAIRAFN